MIITTYHACFDYAIVTTNIGVNSISFISNKNISLFLDNNKDESAIKNLNKEALTAQALINKKINLTLYSCFERRVVRSQKASWENLKTSLSSV